ncbi:hypothetical protein CesoFtcFv8_005713 [Champsocephalus esox]|uniref:tRNA-splicing endonuclease subunit Sen34 n=1 Tax=Champsocephalus esox TaxID=159716 RepID=A0AAN8H6P2_9TELE|nr:hypothetical protein CesoFtcFv8_005713 [Champsocephalus esox]
MSRPLQPPYLHRLRGWSRAPLRCWGSVTPPPLRCWGSVTPPPLRWWGVSRCDSAPLLWRDQDLRAVRGRGLVGALLGALPRTPRQNGRLGRPLLLLPEEERLLAELHATANANQGGGGVQLSLEVKQHLEEQERSLEEQRVLALQDRKSALLHAMTSSHTGSLGPSEALRGRLEALHRSFTFPRGAMAVQLSTARAGLHHCHEDRAFLRAQQPITAQHDSKAAARYQVFRDLRGRGFYLTSAGKFGGDFLVYPGDPLRFHAHFIAVVLSLDSSLSPLDVLAIARLGSNVKKTVLLCSPGGVQYPGGAGGVQYTSLQWSGMV